MWVELDQFEDKDENWSKIWTQLPINEAAQLTALYWQTMMVLIDCRQPSSTKAQTTTNLSKRKIRFLRLTLNLSNMQKYICRQWREVLLALENTLEVDHSILRRERAIDCEYR